MRHGRAKRLLWSLPDGTLPPKVESALMDHVGRCGRCQRQLGEIELADSLVRGIPAAVLPREWAPASYTRLVRLARWSLEPDLPDPDRWRAPTLSVVGALATVAMAFGVGHWDPILPSTPSPIEIAWVPADASYIPSNFSSVRF